MEDKLQEIFEYVDRVTSTGQIDRSNVSREDAIKALWHVKVLAREGLKK